MKAILFGLAALALAPAAAFADTRSGYDRHGGNRGSSWESRDAGYRSGHSAPRPTYRRYDSGHDWPRVTVRPFGYAPRPHYIPAHHNRSRGHH